MSLNWGFVQPQGPFKRKLRLPDRRIKPSVGHQRQFASINALKMSLGREFNFKNCLSNDFIPFLNERDQRGRLIPLPRNLRTAGPHPNSEDVYAQFYRTKMARKGRSRKFQNSIRSTSINFAPGEKGL